MKVIIIEKHFTESGWMVIASIESDDGSRTGPHLLELPESTTDEQLKSAVASLYGQ